MPKAVVSKLRDDGPIADMKIRNIAWDVSDLFESQMTIAVVTVGAS